MPQIDAEHPNAITAYYEGLRRSDPDWIGRAHVMSPERAMAQSELDEHLQGTTPEGRSIRGYYATLDEEMAKRAERMVALRKRLQELSPVSPVVADGRDDDDDELDENGDVIEFKAEGPDLLDTSS